MKLRMSESHREWNTKNLSFPWETAGFSVMVPQEECE